MSTNKDIKELRSKGIIILLQDLEGWARLIAEIFRVKPDEVRFLRKSHIEILDEILEEFGTGKQSGRKCAEVIKMRYGIGFDRHTIEDIAWHFRVSQSAIQMDLRKTIKKLRSPSFDKRLKYDEYIIPLDLRKTVMDLVDQGEEKQITIGDLKRQLEELHSGAGGVEKEDSAEIDPRNRNIDDISFSVRTTNALKSLGIKTLGEYTREKGRELIKQQGKRSGRKCCNEIETMFSAYNITIGA